MYIYKLEVCYIGLLYAVGTDKGKFSIAVDGKEIAVVDAYKSYSNPKEYVISGLANKVHVVEIRTLDDKNASSSGNVCQIGVLLIN